MLTEGAIQDILFKPAEQHPQKPIFQILLNDLVISKHIEAKAVVQLDKYICNIIQETRKVLIVLEVSVLKTANEVVGKIGDPKPINVESKPEQQQQHQNLQQNNQPQRGSAGQVLAQQQSRAGVMGGNKLGAPVRTGGLASATYGSNQQVSRGGNNPKPVYPISSLTPYQNRWTIRVRVTSKSNIRTWSNSKGEGRVFNVDFVDESGEIRATGFNDVVDKFYELLEVNKVYYISKCSLKTANKQYSSIKNDYEMYINNDTIIELCHDPCDLPTIQYNFVSIGDLSNCSGNDIVDILGVVINIDEVSQITTKTTNRQISKRDIMLLDRSEKSVRATLWGDYAEKFEEHVGKNPVLALKGVKVSEYGGRSLSVLNSTNIMVNPLDLKEAHSLREWYMNVGKDTAIESMSGQRSDGSLGAGSYKTLLQVKSEQLGMGDKPDYFTAKATAVFFKKDNCLYKANLADFSGNQWVTCFQESAEAILNTSASQIGQMKDSNDEQAYDQIFSEANFKTYNFRIRGKMETYNDETRLKCSCVGATPLDFQKECRRLIEEIKKLQAL
ncbi:Replication protein A 70 kDa DNA-binding subunit [Acropora cervicornis]|uniref:Replication protein A subunit n=1 Tax=Acropora cervicornis TaxID=6130 RepID=A0AAD9PVC0_ACRCE|nr:Replication protein A 70 kDa DNA-binding subunit [Acropora cervicornis]